MWLRKNDLSSCTHNLVRLICESARDLSRIPRTFLSLSWLMNTFQIAYGAFKKAICERIDVCFSTYFSLLNRVNTISGPCLSFSEHHSPPAVLLRKFDLRMQHSFWVRHIGSDRIRNTNNLPEVCHFIQHPTRPLSHSYTN